MATKVNQKRSDARDSEREMLAANNLSQLKQALRKAFKAINRLERRQHAMRAEIRRLKAKVGG